MRLILRVCLVLMLIGWFSGPAMAQTGRFYYVDDGNRLDRNQVQRAAQPLLDRGAYVAIYAVDSGQGGEFSRLLANDGLLNGDLVRNNLIAIFVSFNDRYSEIRFGNSYAPALNAGNTAQTIQQSSLNRRLAAGDTTGAFTASLAALEQAIADGGSTGSGSATTTTNSSSGLVWLLIPLILVGLLVGWFVFGRRGGQRVLQGARNAMTAARNQAGAAIADMGQAIRSLREKAEFDRVSYAADDVAALGQLDAAVDQPFVQAQDVFKQAEESLAGVRSPTEEQYKTATAGYANASELIGQARTALEASNKRRAELDKLNDSAPATVAATRQTLDELNQQVDVLGDQVQPERVLAPLRELVEKAEGLLNDRRAADALQAAGIASTALTAMQAIFGRFGTLREGLSTGRAAAERAASQGYQIESGIQSFANAEALLNQAAQTLEKSGPEAAASYLAQAEQASQDGDARGGGQPALREQNTTRLAALRAEQSSVAERIAAGRKAFDLVDDFAESTWSDIRGNGSEAESAHAEASARIDEAETQNTMQAQEFVEAATNLEVADERLGFARKLVDAITQRLSDLEAARKAARDEVAAARSDIDQGWAFVRSNDADVGKVPEHTLAEADVMLKQAEAELANQRPNWLQAVKQAQEANRLADEALSQARTEVETITRLRDQVNRAQQVAIGEVQKVVQFVNIHNDDMLPESRVRLSALHSDIEMAARSAQMVDQSQEEARANALRDVLSQYTTLQQRAEQLYQEIYAAFQKAEDLRKQLAGIVQEAQQAINRAEQVRAQAAGLVASTGYGVAQLEQAYALLSSIRSVSSERELQQATERAQEAAALARRAETSFQEAISQQRARQSAQTQDMLRGMVIGSMLGGGGHRHRGGGGGWGGGGGGGGGGWGSGGSSGGGSWGGGGGSGGSGW